jgi:cytidylate kinase
MVSLDEVKADLQARDEADRNRKAAPLRPAENAAIFDTTEMDADTAFAKAYALIKEKMK